MVKTVGLKNYSDIHFTDRRVSQKIIKHYSPSGTILEPFKGDGSFYDYLPENSYWCEIELGVDFFDWNKKVDWVVTNPPFSNLTDVMGHLFSFAENVVLLVPISKIYSSWPRMKLIKEYGGIKEELVLGTGRDIGFNIGFPFAAIHFKKGYRGPKLETWSLDK